MQQPNRQRDAGTRAPHLWLVRHGETAWSRDHRHTGATDLGLLPAGEEAARAVATRLRDRHFGLVLSSPLRRARDTASLAGFPDAVSLDEAVEWNYGLYEGRTTEEIRTSAPGWTVWHDGAPGGESPADVAVRADRLINRVLASAVDRVLLFAHGHLLRVLTARWLEQAPQEGSRYRLDTATVSVLGWERDTRVILQWNSSA